MERLSGWKDLLLRVGLALAIVAGHSLLWQPVRAALATHVAAPVLEIIPTQRAASFDIVARSAPPVVEVRGQGRSVDYSIPGGLYFLVPGIFLALVAPRKPYWAYLLGGLLSLGIVSFAFVILGVGWAPVSFILHSYMHQYVIPALSIGITLLLATGAWRLPAERGGVTPTA